MAEYEKLINNKEGIVGAISHMVGWGWGCGGSVTISIYLCLSQACSHDKLELCSPCTLSRGGGGGGGGGEEAGLRRGSQELSVSTSNAKENVPKGKVVPVEVTDNPN